MTFRERARLPISFDPAEGRTKQSFKEECDINHIMARFKRTGVLEHLASNPPIYGDYDQATDYQSALNQVIQAQESFDALPAHIRKRMGNDPGNLLEFIEDPENREEAEKLGLIRRASDPKITPDPGPDLQGGTASEGDPLPLKSRGSTPVSGGE